MNKFISTDEYFENLKEYENIKKARPDVADTLTAVELLSKYTSISSTLTCAPRDIWILWDKYAEACSDLCIEEDIFSEGSFFASVYMLLYPQETYTKPRPYNPNYGEQIKSPYEEVFFEERIYETALQIGSLICMR